MFAWKFLSLCGSQIKLALKKRCAFYCFEVRLLLPNYFTILKFRPTSVPFSSAPASLMSNFQSESRHIRASPRWFISQLTGVHVEVVLSDLCVRFSEPLNIFFLLLLSYLNYDLACYKIPGSEKFPSIRSVSKPVFLCLSFMFKVVEEPSIPARIGCGWRYPMVSQKAAVCLALYGPWVESLPPR